MFRNYLITAVRSILRQRYFSLIKVVGLALGLGTSLVLLLYISHQLSYDTTHPDVERMYRINQTHIWRPGGGIFHSTGPAVAFALRNEFPEIEDIVRINTPGGYTIRYVQPDGNFVAFNENFDNIFAADSNFFSFFDFKLREGDPKTALIGKDKIVLSDKAAKKLFGDEPALGKLIQLGDEQGNLGDGSEAQSDDLHIVEVTGVTEAQPTNIHFHFDYLLSMPTNPNVKRFEWSWIWTQVVTYVKLRPGTDVKAFQEKLMSFGDRHAPASFQKLGMDYKEFLREKGKWSLFAQPVRDIHLYSNSSVDSMAIGNRLGPVGDIKYLVILGSVALFILVIAIINFVNLSTAHGSKRAKEVGVKKTLGMNKGALIAQFQVEHVLLSAISMLLALGVMEILRLFLQPLGFEVPLSVWDTTTFIIVIILLAIFVGFISGLYPSFYLTSFKPAQVLKGKLVKGFGATGFRNGLVIFQFTVSIALLASTIIVFQQLNFFLNADVGFEKDNLMIINRAAKLNNQLQSFRNEIAQFPGVVNASVTADLRQGAEDIFMREGQDKKITLAQYKVDAHFLETTQLKLVAGRNFELNTLIDNSAIINVSAAHVLGWTPEEAIGQKVIYTGDDIAAQTIIGVVKDFHFHSLHENIAPTIFYPINSPIWGNQRILLVKYKKDQLEELVKSIEQRWNQLVTTTPFAYSFYDEDLKKQYEQEKQLGSLFSIFTFLCITISIIGLVGLVAYSTEQRKKEIGIRKVCGASLGKIYLMINKEYVKLMIVSLVIATPITWYLMQQWLDTFSYRTNINALIFFVAGMSELLLALICVGYLSLRAATLNPAEVLKEE